MIAVARKTEGNNWALDNVGVEDPHEALQFIRRQPQLPGSENTLYAFKLEGQEDDGSPIVNFKGTLD